jgi:DNA helicase II / ATP-dependent DNA helicase PcrA
MLRYALDGTPGRRALAVFVATNYRTNTPLVHQIETSNPAFESALEEVTRDMRAAASPPDVGRVAEVIAGAYARLGTRRGQQTWTGGGAPHPRRDATPRNRRASCRCRKRT